VVNTAVLRLNGGVDGSTHTREENAAAAFKVNWKELVGSYEAIENVWKRALSRAGRMDLDAACGQIGPMRAAAQAFADKVDVVVRHMTDLRCSNEVGVLDHDAIEDALAEGPSRESPATHKAKHSPCHMPAPAGLRLHTYTHRQTEQEHG
jgi:hypothetical protein